MKPGETPRLASNLVEQRYAGLMPLYRPDVVTLWAISAPNPDNIEALLGFLYNADGESQPLPVAQAYSLSWSFEDDCAHEPVPRSGQAKFKTLSEYPT